MRVVWSARARSRLREIREFIATRSPRTADAVVERLVDRAALLAVAPRSGAIMSRIGDERFREVLARPYRIAYRVDADKVVVLTVKHYRQRLVENPSEL